MTTPDRVQDALLPDAIRLAASEAFQNKDILSPHDKQSAFADSFQTRTIAPQDLVTHITQGKAFTMGAFSEGRTKAAFISGQVFGLDLDNNVSVEDCLAHDFINRYAYLIYPTPSSGKTDDNGNVIHKSRVLFIADAPVPDRQQWERLQRALMWHCNTLDPDDACKDAARLFFGSTLNGYHTQDAVLPLAVLSDLAEQMENEIGTYEAERTQAENDRIRAQNERNVSDDKKRERYYKYASAALDNMKSDLQSMKQGGRNNTLYKYGAKAGNFVAAGMISYSECEAILRGAALSSGLSQHEIGNTLPRAINDGQSTPFNTDDLDRQFEQWIADRDQFKSQRETVNEDYQQAKARLKANADWTPIIPRPILEHAHFLSGVRVPSPYKTSWWQTQQVPLSHLSAMLNLTDSRSSSAIVLGRMHVAMRNGALSHGLFSIADIADATGLDRRLVSNAIDDLERGGYIQFLKRESLYNIYTKYRQLLPLETAQSLNTSLANYYYPVFDLDHIHTCLLDMLKRFWLERHSKQGLAERTRDMAEQIGIESYHDFYIWQSRYLAALEDSLTSEAASAYRKEFSGDGHFWRGWHSALKSDFTVALDWDGIDTVKDLRGQILVEWITRVKNPVTKQPRDTNTQDELARLLGCTAATLSSVYKAYNIATIAQTKKIELTADFDDLRPILYELQRDNRGLVWQVSIEETNGWTEYRRKDIEKAKRYYARHARNVTRVFILLNTPSTQKVMTPEEIEAVEAIREQIAIVKDAYDNVPKTEIKAVKKTVKQAQKAARGAKIKQINELMPDLDALIEQYSDMEHERLDDATRTTPEKEATEKAVSKPKIIKSHAWTQHRSAWLHKEVDKELFIFTGYRLIGNRVVDPDFIGCEPPGELIGDDHRVKFIAEGYDLAKVVEWLNTFAPAEPVYKLADYHGIEIEDYDDEINHILKRRYEIEVLKPLYDELVPDFDMPQAPPQQLEIVASEPQPVNAKPAIDPTRHKLFIEFCNKRYEREHANRKRLFARIA